MTTQTTTRRQLLRVGTSVAAYAAGAAIVIGGIAIAGEAKGATGISPGLSRLIAQHRAADERIDRFYETVFNPAVDRHHAMLEAIPQVEHEAAPLIAGHPPLYWSTANRLTVVHAKGIAHADPKHSSQTEMWKLRRREARSFYAATLRRDRAIAKAGRDSGMVAASAREDELWQPIREARQGVYAFPVASIADLSAKLAFIEHTDGMDGEDLLPLVMADVARLEGRLA